jgi:succinate-semialdehyde dehydrogenase/glutarate-semialdehyde dehydrogenase
MPVSAQPEANRHFNVRLLINESWVVGSDGRSLPIIDPSTGEPRGHVAVASGADLERSVEAATNGLSAWRAVSPFDRAQMLRQAASLLRSRAEAIAAILTAEQGKPLGQARHEILSSVETIEWFAEEGKRCFGQMIPGRTRGTHVLTRLEPVGVVAAFTPWNFPISQSVKKVAAALSAGCSIILKGPEEAPGACAELMRCFAEAGLPAGTVGLLYGDPPEISGYLIAHPAVRHVTLTGSVAVGKTVAALAGRHMKSLTLELGGHAPAIVCSDADLGLAAAELSRMKFMNAGQVCLAPTRFLVARSVYREFIHCFLKLVQHLRVDAGHVFNVDMGPLASGHRLDVIQALVDDATKLGATIECGGNRLERPGYFYAPTVLSDVPIESRAMNEEPFGPIALFRPFDTLDEAITEANRLPYGLASYLFTRSITNEAVVTERIEAGMIAVNRIFSSNIEAPFGGIKDSGYGTEGGTFAIRNFLREKMVARYVG